MARVLVATTALYERLPAVANHAVWIATSPFGRLAMTGSEGITSEQRPNVVITSVVIHIRRPPTRDGALICERHRGGGVPLLKS